MLEIYHVPRTRSVRVIWLCEELGLPYTVLPVDFSPAYRASPEWRALNPVGKVPAMRDGDLTMFESGAMLEYILERYGEGRLRPAPGTPEAARYLQWCWFAEATLARPIGDIAQHTFVKPERERIAAVVEDGRQRALLCLDALEDAVDERTYLVGESLTAADIMTGYSLMLAKRLQVLTDAAHPSVNAYQARLEERPGYRKAMADA